MVCTTILAKHVSIRAPVKDATILPSLTFKFTKVSIRAPVKDATNSISAFRKISTRFYPRAREGRDQR